MVDLRNRKVITASLAGVAVVAVSVGVGLGVTRGKNTSGVDGEPPVAKSDPDAADYSPGPLVEKESFLRHDDPTDILDEVEEDAAKSPRVSVTYKNQWGGGSKGGSKSKEKSKGGLWKCGSSPSSSSKAWKGAESWSADHSASKGHPSSKETVHKESQGKGSADPSSSKGTVKESEAKGSPPKEPKGRRRCKFDLFPIFCYCKTTFTL